MTRSRASARAAGTRQESLIAAYLAEHVNDRVERRARSGAADRGDVSGLRLHPALGGGRLVVEVKSIARVDLAGWAAEAERERRNDGAVAAVTAHKRVGRGAAADQWVTLTMRDLVALLTGVRPD